MIRNSFKGWFAATALSAAMMAPLAAQAQLIDRKAMTIGEARNALKAAVEEATKNNWKLVIAIVDDSARLIAFERMDGAPSSSVDIAQGKARSAASFGRSTATLEESIKTRPALASVPFVLLQGGLPIKANGIVIGAVGVSGATSQQDEQVAAAAIAAITGADK